MRKIGSTRTDRLPSAGTWMFDVCLRSCWQMLCCLPLPVPPSRSEKSSQRLKQRLREDPTQAEPPSCTDRRGVDLLLNLNGGESWRGHAVGGAEPKPSRAHRRDTTMTLSGAPRAPRKAEPRTEGEKVASPGTRLVTVQVGRHSHNDIHTTIFLLKRQASPNRNATVQSWLQHLQRQLQASQNKKVTA